MNKRQYINVLSNEISKINRSIDRKILMGYSYDSDAKRHKQLLAVAKRIQRRRRTGVFFSGFFKHAYMLFF